MNQKGLLLGILLSLSISFSQEFKVIGYLMEFRATPSSEKIGKLTHLIHTGSTVFEDGSLDITSNTVAKIQKAVERADSVNTKVMLMVGGWGRSGAFSTVAADETLRKAFAHHLTTFCDTNGIAGADIDWEFPTSAEMKNYELMMKEIRAQFDPKGLLLTAAMGADKGSEFTADTWEQIDWVNLMTYDRNWAANGVAMAGPHSPADQVERLPQWHTEQGLPKEKLVLGVPFYGRNSMNWGDAKAYSELFNSYSPTAEDDTAGGYNYNGPDMIEYKTSYTKTNGYGGVMIWEIEHDLPVNHEMSLLKTINDAVASTVIDTTTDTTENNDTSVVDTERYDGFKVVAYFPVNGDIKDMDEVDFSKLTHVVGAFIQSNADGSLRYPGWKYDPDKSAQEAEEEMLDSLIVRAKRNGVVPMIALGTTAGGWQMTQDAAARTNCVSNLKALVETKGLAGIDLDLEGWVGDANSPFYPEEYALLAQELRDSLGDEYIVTSAVSANEGHVENWTDDMLEVLDWINIMVYDIRVWNSGNIANQSLFSDQVAAAGYWENRGLDKQQIVFGVPFYCRGWDYDAEKPYVVEVDWSPDHSKDSSEWDWGQINTFSYEFLYNKFSLNDDQDSVIVTPEDTMWNDDGWTGYRGTANGVLYYNGANLIQDKTVWARDNGYGGMMIWELAGDIPTSDENSLLKALSDAIDLPVSIEASKQHVKSGSMDLSMRFHNRTLVLNLNAGDYRISLVDLRGREVAVVKDGHLSTGIHLFGLSSLGVARGMYLVRVVSENTGVAVQSKVIIER